MRNQSISKKLFASAKKYFPGGVNSPVRAFRSVEGTPAFIEKGDGCYIWDADRNKYIDYCCSWGPMILGHNHPRVRRQIVKAIEKGTSFGAPTHFENDLAKLILLHNKYIEKIRFVSSGTEAVMSAIRLARGVTGKNMIIKFDGCYHGHSDALLVKAGSGLVTFGVSSSAGVPEALASQTLVLPLNDTDALAQAFSNHYGKIACVIIEPVPANNGLLIQSKQYLHMLRKLCSANQSLLIFDEVISGFRLGFTGAAGHYTIRPDIITYGKIIGGGMPVGAYGASKEIMAFISPDGPVYQAGTLSGNPVAMAAGIAQLQECLKKDFYKKLERKTRTLVNPINAYATLRNYPFRMISIGSIFWPAFTKKPIHTASEIEVKSMELFKILYHELLNNGVYLGPSGYEVGFVSAAHTSIEIEKTVRVFCKSLDKVFQL